MIKTPWGIDSVLGGVAIKTFYQNYYLDVTHVGLYTFFIKFSIVNMTMF